MSSFMSKHLDPQLEQIQRRQGPKQNTEQFACVSAFLWSGHVFPQMQSERAMLALFMWESHLGTYSLQFCIIPDCSVTASGGLLQLALSLHLTLSQCVSCRKFRNW